MALFERLGALKTWAKEAGSARAALARDKRLEDPLSSGILSDHVVQQTVSVAEVLFLTAGATWQITICLTLYISLTGCILWYSWFSDHCSLGSRPKSFSCG